MDDKNKPAHAAGIELTSTSQTTISRRSLLQTGISAGSASLLPLIATSSCSTPAVILPAVLDTTAAATLAAFSNRIVPADVNGPAAADCGVVTYINRSLAEWNQADVVLV